MEEKIDLATLSRLKVAELRQALQERNLDTKGTKPLLIQRLREALETENLVDDGRNDDSNMIGGKVDMDISDNENDGGDKVISEPSGVDVKSECETEYLEEEKLNQTPCPGSADLELKTDSKGTKRKHDEIAKDSAESSKPRIVKEDEPEINGNLVCMDLNNSDLNLKIGEGSMTAEPFHKDGWVWCYAGARATHGVTDGKIWYEAKIVDYLNIWAQKDKGSFDLRVGWSTLDSTLMLGEDEGHSWGYSTLGYKVHNNVFTDWGGQCNKNDIIGSYIDFSGENIVLSWSKNGEDLGQAFEILKTDLKGQALFPHFISRNVKFELNFGCDSSGETQENWAAAISDTFTKLSLVPSIQRVRGPASITKRTDCNLVMMIGLPGSGKTYWVKKFLEENKEKLFYVVSTEEFLKKMTVNGESRQHHCGKMKYSHLVQKVTRNMHDVVKVASNRNRNIVIDQTNVFEHIQKRKSRMFIGKHRKAVVVVPSDQQYVQRRAEQASQEGGARGIPDAAVNEMKASMTIPQDKDEYFEEIVFAELGRDDAESVVAQYIKDARDKGYGQKSQNERLHRNNEEGFRVPGFGRGSGVNVGGFGMGWSGFGMMRGGFDHERGGFSGWGGFGNSGHLRGGSGFGSRGVSFMSGLNNGAQVKTLSKTGGFRQGYPGSKYWGGGWSGNKY